MKRHLEGLYKWFPPSSPQHINILCLFSHREPSVDIHKYSNNENYRFLFTKSFLHVKSIIKVDKVDTLLLFANPGNIFNLFITLLTPTPTHRHQDGNMERMTQHHLQPASPNLADMQAMLNQVQNGHYNTQYFEKQVVSALKQQTSSHLDGLFVN